MVVHMFSVYDFDREASPNNGKHYIAKFGFLFLPAPSIFHHTISFIIIDKIDACCADLQVNQIT